MAEFLTFLRQNRQCSAGRLCHSLVSGALLSIFFNGYAHTHEAFFYPRICVRIVTLVTGCMLYPKLNCLPDGLSLLGDVGVPHAGDAPVVVLAAIVVPFAILIAPAHHVLHDPGRIIRI